MSSPKPNSSPKFKNLYVRPKQSPQEIKEKMRKNYKTKIQNCRDVLLDKFRGQVAEKKLCDITKFYKSMFNFPIETSSEEESEVLEEVKKELLHEEMQWWLNECEKFEMEGIDLISIEQDNVLCPICQIENFKLINEHLTCSHCEISVKTEKSLDDIKMLILSNLEQHSTVCNHEAQFNLIADPSGAHMYLMCESCNDMKLII